MQASSSNGASGAGKGLTGREHRDLERQSREKQKRLSALEREVAEMELRLHRLQSEIEAATEQRDTERIAGLGEEYVQLEQSLQDRYDEWAAVAEETA